MSSTVLSLVGLACGDAAAPEIPGPEVEVAYTAISVSEDGYAPASCGLTTSRQIYCWGSNHSGKLGIAGATEEARIPVLAAGGREFAWVYADWHKTCGLTPGRELLCWGEVRPNDGSVEPVAILNESPRFESVAFSTGFGCGVAAGGSTMCWSPYDREPIPVEGVRFATLFGGSVGICGVTVDRVAYCWRNGPESPPDSLPTDVRFAAISGNCGLTDGGSMYCWGSPGTHESLVPRSVASGMTFASIAVGGTHSCAVDQGGLAYCWGSNTRGQLGNSGGYTTEPTRVSGDVRFQSLAADGTHTCGIDLSGVAYCWGSNSWGQLGDGSARSSARYNDNSATPVRVRNPRM